MVRRVSKLEVAAPGGPQRPDPIASAPRRLAWGGRIFFSPGRMLYVGPGASTGRHAHHAIQVVLSFEESFALDLGDGVVSRRVAIVAADAPHEFHPQPGLMALLYLEPEGPGGRALQRRLLTDPVFVAGAEARLTAMPCPQVETWGASDAARWVDQTVTLLGVPTPAPVLHSAVRKTLALLEQSLDDPPRLDELARRAGVSSTRLVHLFRAQVGLPVRRYILWLRIKRATEAVARGASLTEAAYAAGFADGPHLSRTFRAMFGTNPSLVMPFMEFAGTLWATA